MSQIPAELSQIQKDVVFSSRSVKDQRCASGWFGLAREIISLQVSLLLTNWLHFLKDPHFFVWQSPEPTTRVLMTEQFLTVSSALRVWFSFPSVNNLTVLVFSFPSNFFETLATLQRSSLLYLYFHDFLLLLWYHSICFFSFSFFFSFLLLITNAPTRVGCDMMLNSLSVT